MGELIDAVGALAEMVLRRDRINFCDTAEKEPRPMWAGFLI